MGPKRFVYLLKSETAGERYCFVNKLLTFALTVVLAAGTVTGAAIPAPAQTSATVVEIAASLHVLVLMSDGSVMALGENRSGQLGRPKVISRFLPSDRVSLPAKAVQVAAGEDTSFAPCAQISACRRRC